MAKLSSNSTQPYRITQGRIEGNPRTRDTSNGTYREETVVGESLTGEGDKNGAKSLVSHTEWKSEGDQFVQRYWVGDRDNAPNLRLSLRKNDEDQADLVIENSTAGGAATVEFPAGDPAKAKKLLGDALKKADLDITKTDFEHADARVSRVTLVQKNEELSHLEIVRSVPYPYLDYSTDPPVDRKDPSVRKHDFETMKYGFPGIEHPLFRNNTVVSYSPQHKTANWVAERVNKYSGRDRADRSEVSFKVEDDKDVAPEHKASLSDYENSGFDRGHLAPAANHTQGKRVLEDTFKLANISPQVGEGFNQAYWKTLEEKVRDWGSGDEELYVVTGPAYLSEDGDKKKREVSYQVIGDNEVSVPTHFFKSMLSERQAEVDADTPLEEFLVSTDELEKKTGLDFFNRLPDELESKIEAEKPEALWGEGEWVPLEG